MVGSIFNSKLEGQFIGKYIQCPCAFCLPEVSLNHAAIRKLLLGVVSCAHTYMHGSYAQEHTRTIAHL